MQRKSREETQSTQANSHHHLLHHPHPPPLPHQRSQPRRPLNQSPPDLSFASLLQSPPKALPRTAHHNNPTGQTVPHETPRTLRRFANSITSPVKLHPITDTPPFSLRFTEESTERGIVGFFGGRRGEVEGQFYCCLGFGRMFEEKCVQRRGVEVKGLCFDDRGCGGAVFEERAQFASDEVVGVC
jgi:hypothetical protein